MKYHALTAADEEKARRVAWLISGFLRNSLTEAELDELDAWIVANDENQLLFEELTDPKNIETGIQKLQNIDTEAALQKIKGQMETSNRPGLKRNRRYYWTYGIAASLLLLAGLFYFTKLDKENKPPVVTSDSPDLKPGGNKATLTLIDGTVLDLEEHKKGLLKQENGVQVNKVDDGQLTYLSDEHVTPGDLKYNILSTPKGGQYRVVLSDGTIAWLNAASSLKFPVQFTGAQRIVELTGEVYFEVAATPGIPGGRALKPFIVRKGDMHVEVLGTHFNVNAYDDESEMKVTLLEGSVKVGTNSGAIIIKPGEQASVVSNRKPSSARADLSEAIAWKEGKFIFKNAPIESIMRQVSRWYDVEIEYQGKVNYHFNATIDRNLPVSKLFKRLELTDNVHFTITEKKIIVKP